MAELEDLRRLMAECNLEEVKPPLERVGRLYNEDLLYKDIKERDPDSKGRWILGRVGRGDDVTELHLNYFTLFEIALFDTDDLDAGVELARVCVRLLAGEIELREETGLKQDLACLTQPEDGRRTELFHKEIELANIYVHNRHLNNPAHTLLNPGIPTVDIGVGIERCMMAKTGVKDIRLLDMIERLDDHNAPYFIERVKSIMGEDQTKEGPGWYYEEIDYARMIKCLIEEREWSIGLFCNTGFLIMVKDEDMFGNSLNAYERIVRTQPVRGVATGLRNIAMGIAKNEWGCKNYFAANVERCTPHIQPGKIEKKMSGDGWEPFSQWWYKKL